MEYIRQFWLQLLCPCNALFISSPLSGPLHYPPPLLFVPAFLTCSFESVIPPCFFHYLSALARAEYKKRERESFSWVEGARVPYVTPGLISPLIYAAAKRANRRPWKPIKADRFSACVPIPLTYLGCPLFPFCPPADVNVIGATLAAQLNRFYTYTKSNPGFFLLFPLPPSQSLLLSLRRVRISNRSQFNWDCGGEMDTSSWFTCNGFTGI